MTTGRRVPESVAAPGGVAVPSGPRFYAVPRLTPLARAQAQYQRKMRLARKRLEKVLRQRMIAAGVLP